MFFVLLLEFPFNDKFNGVFKNTYNKNEVSAIASSSITCYFSSVEKDVLTKPESVIDPNDELEWCSKFSKLKTDRPWITIIFKNKKLSMSGYSIKSGCCQANWCCCILYSWSLFGSNDNKTWTKLHSVEKEKEFRQCQEKSFRVDKKGSFKMFKLIQEEPDPECLFCMDIAKLEFYGSLDDDEGDIEFDSSNEDEISIIGRVKN